MRRAILVCACVLAWLPLAALAQDSQPSAGSGSSTGQSQAKIPTETTLKIAEKAQEAGGPKFVRTLTNVQVELTLTDHIGTQPPDKKTVSMIVSSGNWGKVRSAGSVMTPGAAPFGVELNVDARPFVTMEGQIQLELALAYRPPEGANKDTIKASPTGLNQSLTVILQSGKPLVVSQAADPISDRKMIVEVKATILK